MHKFYSQISFYFNCFKIAGNLGNIKKKRIFHTGSTKFNEATLSIFGDKFYHHKYTNPYCLNGPEIEFRWGEIFCTIPDRT